MRGHGRRHGDTHRPADGRSRQLAAHTRGAGSWRRVPPAGQDQEPSQARLHIDRYLRLQRLRAGSDPHQGAYDRSGLRRRLQGAGLHRCGERTHQHRHDGGAGVPIYWLNGDKVADDYGDFYDGTWSSRNSGRGVAGELIAGNSASGRQLLCTGTADDGTTTDLPLGGGDPDSDSVDECTATSIAITSSTLGGDVLDVSGRAQYLALSSVFRVGSAVVPVIEDVSISSDPGSDREYEVGDDICITVTFSEAVVVTGTPGMLFRVDALNAGGELVQRNRRANYDAGASSSTELAFSYTVRSVDFDRDGIRIRADSLRLRGGTIMNGSDVDAVLDHDEVDVQSGHRIHVRASATGARVVSAPAEGTSYSTGETITIEVSFNRDVRVITEDGTPTYEMRFGPAGDTVGHHAAYARVVSGNRVQFDYLVQEGDNDPDGFGAQDPAIHWNGGVITRAEVHDSIAGAVRATVTSTYLLRQDGHAVNAE